MVLDTGMVSTRYVMPILTKKSQFPGLHGQKQNKKLNGFAKPQPLLNNFLRSTTKRHKMLQIKRHLAKKIIDDKDKVTHETNTA